MSKITAIAGRNGSGKTLYIDQLRKQLASDKVRYIAFTDSYGVNIDGQYYLQLRWNQHDTITSSSKTAATLSIT